MKDDILKPEKAFPKLPSQEERLAEIEHYADYYSRFKPEKLTDYILGSKFNDKSDLSRPYVCSLSQAIGTDLGSTIESLYSTKLQPKSEKLTKTRVINTEKEEFAQINEAIEVLKVKKENAVGKEKFIIQKAIVELYQDRAAVNSTINPEMKPKLVANVPSDNTSDHLSKIDFKNPRHIKETIKAYAELMSQMSNDTTSGATEACKALMTELMDFVDEATQAGHIRKGDAELIKLRSQGYQNKQIKTVLSKLYQMDYTTDYYSTLFSRICKKIAQWVQLREQENQGKSNKYNYAVCTRCGERKFLSSVNWVKKHCSPTGYAA